MFGLHIDYKVVCVVLMVYDYTVGPCIGSCTRAGNSRVLSTSTTQWNSQDGHGALLSLFDEA